MSFGEYRSNRVVNQSDTALLRTPVWDQDNIPIPAEDIISVNFIIQSPDESRVTFEGTIDESGEGFLNYNGTDQLGKYLVVAQFELITGEKISERSGFVVVDPFSTEPVTKQETISDAVWLRIEDCFDSTEGGPWLRDVTLSFFNKTKIPQFINDTLFEINMQPPDTALDIDYFTTPGPNGAEDTDMPLLVQGVLLSVIRHLMRSYTEQPTPTGGQVVYEDRTRYRAEWQAIYQIELERYTRWLALWKRQFLHLGKTSILVSSKAGRMIPAAMRSRHVGRGWY